MTCFCSESLKSAFQEPNSHLLDSTGLRGQQCPGDRGNCEYVSPPPPALLHSGKKASRSESLWQYQVVGLHRAEVPVSRWRGGRKTCTVAMNGSEREPSNPPLGRLGSSGSTCICQRRVPVCTPVAFHAERRAQTPVASDFCASVHL